MMAEFGWRIAERVAFVVSDPGRVLVMSLEHPERQPRSLLGTAAAIWLHLVGETNCCRPWTAERELLACVAEQFDVPADTIKPDVIAFLTEMADEGLVESGSELN